jgi:KaiC/GvpD/RAD55 family RecA-like ATPase
MNSLLNHSSDIIIGIAAAVWVIDKARTWFSKNTPTERIISLLEKNVERDNEIKTTLVKQSSIAHQTLQVAESSKAELIELRLDIAKGNG